MLGAAVVATTVVRMTERKRKRKRKTERRRDGGRGRRRAGEKRRVGRRMGCKGKGWRQKTRRGTKIGEGGSATGGVLGEGAGKWVRDLSGGLRGGCGGEERGRGGLAGEFSFPEPGEEDGDGEEGDDVEDHAAAAS